MVKLEQNYRSTRTILSAAGKVVEKNRGRKSKTLWTENPGGERIVYRRLEDEREEARFVCREIGRFVRRGGSCGTRRSSTGPTPSPGWWKTPWWPKGSPTGWWEGCVFTSGWRSRTSSPT